MRKLFIALIFSLAQLTVTLALHSTSASARTINSSGGMVPVLQATPTPLPTSAYSTQSTEMPVRGRPPLSLTLILLGLCCFFLLLIGMLILGFVVRNQNIKEWKNDQQSNSR